MALSSSDTEARLKITSTGDTSGIDKVRGGLSKLDDSADKSSQAQADLAKASDLVRVAMLAAGVAAVGVAALTVKGAADFETGMNVLQAVSGATNEQMTLLQNKAKALGNDLSLPGVSASDAAAAMTELAKAGLDVNDIMNASKGVLQAAKAGNIGYAESASIVSNALLAFKLEGKEATRVADLFAAAANASSADVVDVGAALQQTGAQAAQLKIPLEDTVTMLAELANQGIRGSDAGTSIKTMLARLVPQTAEASKAFKDLGIDVFDANGNFIGTREAIAEFQDGLKNLNDEQRQTALYTIFGSDAIRAASIIVGEGTAGFDKMSEAVNKQGAAQQLAASRAKGFNGAIEGLKSSLETIGLEMGLVLLPVLTDFTNMISANLVPGLKMGRDILVGWLPVISGIAAAMLVYHGTIGIVTVATRAYAAAQLLLNGAMTANPILGLIAVTAGLVAAYAALSMTSDATKSANDRLAQAQRDLTVASDAAKDAQYRLKDSQMTQEGAALRAERAQLNHNDAVKRFTDSLEAREAAYYLKGANDELAKANEDVKVKTDNARKAEEEKVKAKDRVIEANNQITGSIQNQSREMDILSGKLNNLNGFKATYTIEQAQRIVMDGVSSPASKQQAWSQLIPKSRFASGTDYAPGGMALVGEEGPELVELPRGSKVKTNKETNEMAGGRAGAVFNNTYHIYKDVDIEQAMLEQAWRISNP